MYYLTKYESGSIYIERLATPTGLSKCFEVVYRVRVSPNNGFDIGTIHTANGMDGRVVKSSESLEELVEEAALLAL